MKTEQKAVVAEYKIAALPEWITLQEFQEGNVITPIMLGLGDNMGIKSNEIVFRNIKEVDENKT